MVNGIIRLILILFVLIVSTICASDLVINEIMSNEPGGDKDFEWIEIYNNTSAPQSPSWYYIIINSGPQLQSPYFPIPAFQYGILCSDIVKYESIWGDSSGTWGDDSFQENYPVFELSGINLENSDGIIYLIAPKPNNQFDTVSTFEWIEAGPDGVSWERVLPDSVEIRNSINPTGSTPGRMNSITPRANDLGIASVRFWPDIYNETGFEITIVNFGLNPMLETTLTIHYDLDHDTVVTDDDLIAIAYLPQMLPGDTLDLIAYFELDGILPYVLIKLPDDDQPYNDIWLEQVSGREYPPIIISEFLPDPETSPGVEWVELKNRSTLDIDLQGWLLGDEKTFHPITSLEYILHAGDYALLCKDSTVLSDFYNDNSIPIIEMSSWAILNNDKDIVRLKNNYGYVVDSFSYDHVFGGNRSWARGEEAETADRWGWSVYPGGTPGRANIVRLDPAGTALELTITPNPFSPEINGQMIIEFSVPAGDNITLKIYDLQGRVVRTLIDNLPPYDGTITWRGDTDSGRRLKIGMYVLYMEVSGVAQYKQTIVIAP
jgi:hypothetical protein